MEKSSPCWIRPVEPAVCSPPATTSSNAIILQPMCVCLVRKSIRNLTQFVLPRWWLKDRMRKISAIRTPWKLTVSREPRCGLSSKIHRSELRGAARMQQKAWSRLWTLNIRKALVVAGGLDFLAPVICRCFSFSQPLTKWMTGSVVRRLSKTEVRFLLAVQHPVKVRFAAGCWRMIWLNPSSVCLLICFTTLALQPTFGCCQKTSDRNVKERFSWLTHPLSLTSCAKRWGIRRMKFLRKIVPLLRSCMRISKKMSTARFTTIPNLSTVSMLWCSHSREATLSQRNESKRCCPRDACPLFTMKLRSLSWKVRKNWPERNWKSWNPTRTISWITMQFCLRWAALFLMWSIIR